MGQLEDAQRAAANLSPSDKAKLVLSVVRDLNNGTFPGIDIDADICDGEARIMRTRIPVWVLEQARRLGATEAELLNSYPTLRAGDLATAWVYVSTHADEIDRNIRENEEAI